MNEFEKLVVSFRPCHTYTSPKSGTTVRVDGAMIRVDEDLLSQRERTGFNNTGFIVDVEDFLPDAQVLRNAWVSTGRDTAAVTEKSHHLLGSLYNNRHETPFEGGSVFRLCVTTPINLAQPWFQIFAAHSELSGRYSEIEESWAPEVPSSNNHASIIRAWYAEAQQDSVTTHDQLRGLNIVKEQRRLALTYSFLTQFKITTSLRHLLDLQALESHSLVPDGFWQTRDDILLPLLKDWAPWIASKISNNPKKVRTAWASEMLANKTITDRMGTETALAHEHVHIERIGQLWLLDYYGSDRLSQLGVHTMLNPTRGFGHSGMTLMARVPIFVHRQWVRHRYGAWSELPVDFDAIVNSRDFYVPLQFREPKGGAKTISYDYQDVTMSVNTAATITLNDFISRSIERYRRLRDLELSPREAALVLPYCFRVNTLWTAPVESLMNFFSLRCDGHAQWETRQFANQIYLWFRERFPWANEIFLKHLNFGKSDLFQS